MKGRLIVLEGIDGAGTETQSKKLLSYLKEQGIPAERIYLPNYEGPIGRLIHDFLHGKHDFPVDIQVLLFGADHINASHTIRKWLAGGKVVVCDRFITSTIAYQGLKGFPREKIMKLIELFDVPKPDYIIFLKVSPETSLKRKQKEKPDSMDRHERDKAFLGRVTGYYEKLIEDNVWSNWYVVDGEKSIEDVHRQIREILRI